MRVFHSFQDLQDHAGQEIGCSDWLTMTQERIDRFAEATEDRQWIHVDPDRAAQESPFGTTVAHGYLTLSLIPAFLAQVFDYAPKTAALNYGLERVRFVSPVLVDSRLRGAVRLDSAAQARADAIRVGLSITIEIEGQRRPACTAKAIALLLTEAG